MQMILRKITRHYKNLFVNYISSDANKLDDVSSLSPGKYTKAIQSALKITL